MVSTAKKMNAASSKEVRVSPESGQPCSMVLSETGIAQYDASQGNESIESGPNASLMSGAKHILFGRGKGFAQNPGNQRMRLIVNKYKSQYISGSRTVKHKLLRKAYDEIVEGDVMFLKQVGSGSEWVEVEAEVAMEKVAHSLRCRKDCKVKVQESMTETSVDSSMNKRTELSHEILPHQEVFNLQRIPPAAAVYQLGDEVLRRAVMEQQALDVVNSVRVRSLLVQQLQIERLRTTALIRNLTSIQPPSASILESQSSKALEQGHTLLQTMASRRSMFSG